MNTLNPKRFVLAFVAVFAGIFVTDFLIHGFWLKSAYVETMELWRPEPDMLTHMGWVLRGEFLAAITLVLLWACFAAPASLGRACAFGLVVGLFQQATTLFTYAVQPLPGSLAGKWLAAGVAQSVLMGLIVGLTYKPRPVTSPSPTKRATVGWFAVPVLLAVVLFGSAVFKYGTRQQKTNVTADWMRPLDSKWTIESPGKPYSIQSAADVKREGVDSLRFELRKGEQWTDPLGRSSYRAEVDLQHFPPMRSVRWYAFSLYLPADFPKEDNRLVLAQWHGVDKRQMGEVSRSPVMAVRYVGGRFCITLRHSAERVVRDAEAVPSETLFETKDFPHAQWNDFVVQSKWSYEDDGFVNVWWNGKQIVQYRGPVGYNDNVGPYVRFGLYRDATDKTYVAYFNNVRCGNSPEDVGFDPSTAARYLEK